jgi:hypothetical protein
MLAKFKAVDYGGCATSLAATVLLLIGLTWGGIEYPWKSAQGESTVVEKMARSIVADSAQFPTVLVPLVLSAVLFVVFLVIEGKIASHPIIPLRVFTNAASAGVLAATFLLGSAY